MSCLSNRQQICCNSTQDSIHPLQFITDGVRVVCDGMEEEEEKAGEEGEAEEENDSDL